MDQSLPDISVRDLFKKGDFAAVAQEAEREAHQIIAAGGFVRQDFSCGHVNNSRTSTPLGTLTVAQKAVERLPVSSGNKEAFFGENIREATATIRSFFHRDK